MSLGRILAVGARSPLGLDARQVALAQRAQKLTPRRLTLGEDGASFGTARAFYVPDDVFGFERIVALAAPALGECLATSPAPRPERVAIHLAVPDARPTTDERLGRALLDGIAAEAGLRVDPRSSTTIAGGHAGFAVALERALATSRSTGEPALAGAIDSYHDEATLRWLSAAFRLHGPGVFDGFIPSEGAAFALVSAEPRGPRLAGVSAIELAADETDEDAADPAIALAMTQVVDRALDRAAGPVDWILTDVNGERHRAKEWSFVAVRLRHRLDPEVVQVARPYEDTGDAGAATGALFASYACMTWELGFSSRPRVLLALRADSAPRAAVVLEAP